MSECLLHACARKNRTVAATTDFVVRLGFACLLLLQLNACGGGGDDANASSPPESGLQQTSIPATGNGSNGKTGATSGTAVQTEPLVAMLNAARATPRTCGNTPYPAAGPVLADATLEQTASGHTAWMQQVNGNISHTGAGGTDPGARLDAAGYLWSAVGENVARGYDDARSVIDAWLASAGHCANIMGANFTVVGYAMAAPAGNAQAYSTLMLARPR